MATSSTNEEYEDENDVFVNTRAFPPVVNGRINIVKFLEASTDLVAIVDRLGTAFTPVKYDMQGNIDKIRKHYKFDENSCLLELMLDEVASGKTVVAESILWLNRALLFFELAFLQLLHHLRLDDYDVKMKKIFTVAYDGSVKKYHNWVTQQVFSCICKIAPTLPQIMKSFQVDDNIKAFQKKLEKFNISLHLIRCKIDDFFKDQNILIV